MDEIETVREYPELRLLFQHMCQMAACGDRFETYDTDWRGLVRLMRIQKK